MFDFLLLVICLFCWCCFAESGFVCVRVCVDLGFVDCVEADWGLVMFLFYCADLCCLDFVGTVFGWLF